MIDHRQFRDGFTKLGDAITSGIRSTTFHAAFMLLMVIPRDKIENT